MWQSSFINVSGIQILDTVFHPKCDIHFGTTWKASSLNGRFQGLLLKAGFYQPFLRAVNEIRGEFGLSFCPTRDVLYKDHPIIDPNVPSYMRLSQAVDNYWQVGPLLISRNSDSDEPGELIDFKGDNKLVYLTLGGSAKSHLFIEFINDIVLRLVNFTGGKVKFVITTGLVVDPEDVYKRLGENSTSCLVRNYYDAQVVTSVADVAVGVMGHGHILSAVKNGCPVVVCPVNADQVTHGNLVSRLNLGESPLRISFSEMFTSDVLVKKILSSTELLAATVMRVLENSLRYGNPQLMCELNEYSEDMQLDAVRKLLIRSPG